MSNAILKHSKALPPGIQSRVLLTAVRHPAVTAARNGVDGNGHANANDATDAGTKTAEIVRDLLSAGGVVAVKLAQMIAEDPKVFVSFHFVLLLRASI